MKPTKLLIVGGVAGGASAAARARRLDERAEIVLVERGPDVSFANCGLPYYLGGVITSREKLLVTTAARLRERFRLDVRNRCEAVSIDPEAKTVLLRNLSDGTETVESYDKLILSPGAAPIVPPFAQGNPPGIFTLRNLEDADRIQSALSASVREAAVVGAGFIGLEMAENLVHRGVKTHLVELADQVLPPLDPEMTRPILETLRRHGVELHLESAAEQVVHHPGGSSLKLSSGVTLEVQAAIVGVGVRPENKLAVAAGLAVGPRGGIRVDEFLRTSDPHIYAAGDCIETRDVVTGGAVQVPLAGPANRQGRIAAENALGGSVRFRGVQGTAVCGVFEKTAACTGLSEKALVRNAKEDPNALKFEKVFIHPANHAGYYPGAEGMSLKLLFETPSGRILGAQAVGGSGVDKRIDVLATAIQAKMTVFDLEELELSYAPQYGSAKDPVNMAGFVAANHLRGIHPLIQVPDLPAAVARGALLLDVRTATEFAAGRIPGSVNIPVDELRSRLEEIPPGKEVVAYCQVGMRGYLATRILQQHGVDVKNLSGGFKSYTLFHP